MSDDTEDPIDAAILKTLAGRPSGASISAEDAARVADAENWRPLLRQVRTRAIGLARAGRLVITRKGKPVDPSDFKGVYRLRLPR